MTSANDAREMAGKLTAAAALLARINETDVLLADNEAASKAANTGLLPKRDVAQAMTEWLLRNARPGDGKRFVANTHRHPVNPQETSTEAVRFLCWLLGPAEVEKLVKAAVQREPFREGLSAEARAKRTAELAAERTQLVAQRAALVDECQALGAVGINPQHLVETEAQRERERQETERNTVEAAALARRAEALDRQHAVETAMGA